MVGPKATGKTCLLERFAGQSLRSTQSHFPDLFPRAFITFELDDIRIKFDVFDLPFWDANCYEPNPIHASMDEIETERHLYDAQGFVLVFSVTDRKSFNELHVWLQCVYKNFRNCVILIGNKCDLEDERQVSYVEAKDFATRNRMLYIEVSSKDRTNVELILPTLATLIIKYRSR